MATPTMARLPTASTPAPINLSSYNSDHNQDSGGSGDDSGYFQHQKLPTWPPGLDFNFNLYIPAHLTGVYRQAHVLRDLLKVMAGYRTATELALSFAGLLANAAVMGTFARMGLADTLTIVLFNIAISDLGHFVCRILEFYSYVMDDSMLHGYDDFKHNRYSVRGLENVSSIFQSIMILANALLTTFLALQRCLCVVRPFQFKGMFTRGRTLLVVSAIWGYCLLSNVPRLSQVRIHWKLLHINRTERRGGEGGGSADQVVDLPSHYYVDVLYISVTNLNPESVDPITKLINDSILLFVCQATVISSLFVMFYSLRKSARFRQKASKPSIRSDGPKRLRHHRVDKRHNADTSYECTTSPENATVGSSTSRERQVIIQVALVSVIFVVAHLHKTLYEFSSLILNARIKIEHGFGVRIYETFNGYFYIFNSSINIFIYLKYNSKFRQHFFRRREGRKSKRK